MSKLYIVRHGRTDLNNKKIVQGRSDVSINQEGIDKTKSLKKVIDLYDIDICICSPLKRAKETANILVGDRLDIITDDLLSERYFGDYEGKRISPSFIGKMWNYELNFSDNGLESIKDCLNRGKIFLDKIKEKYPDKNILIVSHGCTIKSLHYNLIGYDNKTNFLEFYPNNSDIYSYDF